MLLCLNITATTFFRHVFFKNISIILFENWQGVNPMGLSTSLGDYLKKILNKHENVTNILKIKHKNSRDIPNGPLWTLVQLFY